MQSKPLVSELQALLPQGRIGTELGEGGYKCVYQFQVDSRVEALKVVHIPQDANDPSVQEENTQRLMREIRLLASCQTPYLVKLGSICPEPHEIGGQNYVIYSEELLTGESLDERIRQGQRPDAHELATVGNCCLLAVQELWQKAVVHRDIKPANIMATMDPARPFVLLDLGVAFVVGGTLLTGDPRLIMGTIYYFAPEMLEQDFRDNLDYRADLYATGLTLYEYACGQNPFARRNDAQYTTLRRVHSDTAFAAARPASRAM
jgi:eukaryotic-like serine/threonine-protein kinase